MKMEQTVLQAPTEYLQQWYQSDIGQALLLDESNVINQLTQQLFGYHLMKLSVCDAINFCQDSKVRHQFSLSLFKQSNAQIIAQEALPIASESIDVAVLHHALEYTHEPHALLRDLSRVIVPSGYMVLVLFNPVGPIRLLSAMSFDKKRRIWPKKFIGKRQLMDWLSLMDFSVELISHSFYRLPVNGFWGGNIKPLERLCQRQPSPVSSVYYVLARKNVSRLTPIRFFDWRIRAKTSLVNAKLYSEREPTLEPVETTQLDNSSHEQ